MIIDSSGRTLVVITGGEASGSIGLAWPKGEGDRTIRVDTSAGMLMKQPSDIRHALLGELRAA